MAETKALAGDDGGLEVIVVTPLGPVVSTKTAALTAPGELGEFEVFPGHVPFLTELHEGVLILGTTDRKYFAVGRGFLEVEPDGTIQVLVEQAISGAEVDTEAAKADVKETAPKLEAWKEAQDGEYKTLRTKHDWAQAMLDAHSLASA